MIPTTLSDEIFHDETFLISNENSNQFCQALNECQFKFSKRLPKNNSKGEESQILTSFPFKKKLQLQRDEKLKKDAEAFKKLDRRRGQPKLN